MKSSFEHCVVIMQIEQSALNYDATSAIALTHTQIFAVLSCRKIIHHNKKLPQIDFSFQYNNSKTLSPLTHLCDYTKQ